MNTETRNYENEKKDIFDMAIEIETKAKRYDILKEAVEKIKEEIEKEKTANPISENSKFFNDGVHTGMVIALNIIDKHTKGLI